MQQLVSEFLDSLKNKKYSPNSIQSHRLDLRKFLKWLKIDENNYDSQELLEKIRSLNLADKLLTLQKKVSKYDGIEDDLESLSYRLEKFLEEK